MLSILTYSVRIVSFQLSITTEEQGVAMDLPTASEMQTLDRFAIEEFGIPGVVLMENAGVGTVNMMERILGPSKDTFACIFIGPGNNGGDGLVIGRHLHQRGCKPVFFFLINPDDTRGDSQTNMAIVQKLKLPFHVIDTDSRVPTIPVLYKQIESRGLPCYAIVDSIFGIGLQREVKGHFASTIDIINNRTFGHGVPVVSVDCPSGMDADSGKTMGTCIRADYTATYGCAKPGHFIHDSRELTGLLDIIDIGIPHEALERVSISNKLINYNIISTISTALTRKNSSHKGDHGHLLLLAGSTGKTGAAILSALGALRSGCGLISLCAPQATNTIFETRLIEAMTIPLEFSSNCLSSQDLDEILEKAKNKQAAILGPGIGTAQETAELVHELYHRLTLPLVVDADALNILATDPDSIKKSIGLRIFTPHPGELSRLIGWSVPEIQQNRLGAARHACRMFNNDHSQNIVILKGAGTIISCPSTRTLINTSGNPGMATGGMGDVLTGIIGALLCQGIDPIPAVSAAVYLHGAAADKLFEQKGIGYTASEVADIIPYTLKSLYS